MVPLQGWRKVFRARKIAIISEQLMCRHWSRLDQELNAILSSYSTPQPELEASVVTTFRDYFLRSVPMKHLIQAEGFPRGYR